MSIISGIIIMCSIMIFKSVFITQFMKNRDVTKNPYTCDHKCEQWTSGDRSRCSGCYRISYV